MALAAAANGASTYSFGAITANSVNGPAIGAAQLSVTVDTGGAGLVSFVFKNTGATSCFIGNVYWDDAPTQLLTGISSIVNGPGVLMVAGGSPSNLPAGNTVNFDANYASKKSGAASNGVNPGEQVEYLMSLASGKTLFDVTSALDLGTTAGMRLGIHLQGLPGGASESFVNKVPESNQTSVPLPSAAGLGFAGLAVSGLRRRR